MEFSDEHTVSFTGHRSYAGEGADALREVVELLWRRGVRVFMSGMALGFDMAAAEAVVALRKRHPAVRLVAVVPFRGQEQSFSKAERTRWERLIAAADEVVTLAEEYRREVYAVRNNYLVDHATTLVTWYNGSEGGTRYTIRRALRHDKKLIHLCPTTPLAAYPEPKLF